MPYQSPLGPTYDCGEFETSMDMALKLADVGGLRARGARSRRRRGKLRGLGIVNAIEQAAGAAAGVRRDPLQARAAARRVLMGTKNQGQGHETTFKQILHERLGHRPGRRALHRRRHRPRRLRHGHMGSRSTVIGGSALWMAADKVIAKGKKIAAHLLEAAEADIEFADGRFRVAGTDRAVALKQVATAAFQPAQLPPGVEPGLYETRHLLAEAGHLAQRLPRLRGRGRSRHRRGRRSSATWSSTTSAR